MRREIDKATIKKVRKLFLGPSDGKVSNKRYWSIEDLNKHLKKELYAAGLDLFLPRWKRWSIDRKFQFLLMTGRIY